MGLLGFVGVFLSFLGNWKIECNKVKVIRKIKEFKEIRIKAISVILQYSHMGVTNSIIPPIGPANLYTSL